MFGPGAQEGKCLAERSGMVMQLKNYTGCCRPQITFRSCGISMNNGITGDNDLNLALDVTAGQMNYSAITNSSTCFIVRAPTASVDVRLVSCLYFHHFWNSMHRGPEESACLVMCVASAYRSRRRRSEII